MRTILAIHLSIMTMMILSMAPGVSMDLWRSMTAGWKRQAEKREARRKQETEDRMKRYYEIDMRRFK